jgi:thioredoxin reductase (NADPH)
MKAEQVIIIGAGPAGLATAIQLKRYGVHPLIFEREQMGGLLRNANFVENYPGFPQGISGLDLVNLIICQAKNLCIDLTNEEVLELSYDQRLFQVRTRQQIYTSQLVVIATGTKPLQFKHLLIPEDISDKVLYEVKELLQIECKHIVIAGSGDAAFDYALNLSRKNRITLLNRGDQPKCLPLLWERARKVADITYINNTEIKQLRKDTDGGLWLDCQTDSGTLQLNADYLVGAIGREACLDFLPDVILKQAQELQEQGILHMIGDVKNGIYRQTAIAVGDGVMTAMKICRQLEEISE